MLNCAKKNIYNSDDTVKSNVYQIEMQMQTINKLQKEHSLLSKDQDDKINEVKQLKTEKNYFEKQLDENRSSCMNTKEMEGLLGTKKVDNTRLRDEIEELKSRNRSLD